jgi:hypothetical protein
VKEESKPVNDEKDNIIIELASSATGSPAAKTGVDCPKLNKDQILALYTKPTLAINGATYTLSNARGFTSMGFAFLRKQVESGAPIKAKAENGACSYKLKASWGNFTSGNTPDFSLTTK